MTKRTIAGCKVMLFKRGRATAFVVVSQRGHTLRGSEPTRDLAVTAAENIARRQSIRLVSTFSGEKR